MSHAVLVVDDEPHILKAIKRTLRGGDYDIHLAESGAAAVKILTETEIAVIICDQRMPVMNGAQVLAESVKLRPDAYRITLTGQTDLNTAQQSINEGKVNQFLFKPWDDQFLRDLVRQAIHTYQLVNEKRQLEKLTAKQKIELEILNQQLEEKVRQRTKELEQRNESLLKLQNHVEQSLRDIVGVLATLLETSNPSLGIHSKRVAQVARHLGTQLELNEGQLRNLEFAAHLHDIGKISPLSDQHDQHPKAGYAILSKISRFESVARGVRHQHEWFEGSGFPDGFKGQKIPLASRVIALANAYDKAVYASKNPTKLSHQAGRKVLIDGQGKQFDPQLVQIMLQFLDDVAPETPLASNGDGEVELSPKQINEGMILSRDLCNANGILMLKQGTLLTSSLVDRVRDLSGVDVLLTSVYVRCSQEDSPANTQDEPTSKIHDAPHGPQTLPPKGNAKIGPVAETDGPPSSATSDFSKPQMNRRRGPSIFPDQRRGKILIVDDDVLVCNALKRDMRRHGFDAVITNSGHDALRQVESSHYDAVITDLMMPGMSGEQLVERLEQFDADLACIVLTGNATKEGVMNLAKAPNVASVLVKPWDSNRLIDALASVIPNPVQ